MRVNKALLNLFQFGYSEGYDSTCHSTEKEKLIPDQWKKHLRVKTEWYFSNEIDDPVSRFYVSDHWIINLDQLVQMSF